MGAVGRSHLQQARPAGLHDVGHTEGATDLNLLAARDGHSPAVARKRRQRQKDRGGVVVYDSNVFAAKKAGEAES